MGFDFYLSMILEIYEYSNNEYKFILLDECLLVLALIINWMNKQITKKIIFCIVLECFLVFRLTETACYNVLCSSCESDEVTCASCSPDRYIDSSGHCF